MTSALYPPEAKRDRIELLDVSDCSRCGGAHARLVAKRFAQPPKTGHQYWTTCPASGEPVLVYWTGQFRAARRLIDDAEGRS